MRNKEFSDSVSSLEVHVASGRDLASRWVAQKLPDWQAMAEASGQVMLLLDDDARVLHSNRGLHRWGLLEDRAETRGALLHELLHPQCAVVDCPLAHLSHDFVTARHNGRPLSREIRDSVLERNIRMLVIPVTLMPADGSAGNAILATIVRLKDVTVHKRTVSWLRDSVDELTTELKKRTTDLAHTGDQLHRAEAALHRAESELRLLSAALMTMQEMERKRIATELHDSIGQSLNALGFGVGLALDAGRGGDSRLACDMLEKLAPQVKETIAEVRRIAMDLRPAMLDDLGIVGTLAWFLREFRCIHPGIVLLTEVNIDEPDVAPALRTTIFRIVQEAVNNVVKHARANEVRIRLWRSENEVHLEVSDNGSGFDLAVQARSGLNGTGMGLKGMRDRAEFSGGRFRLESESGKGTKISASWPVRKD